MTDQETKTEEFMLAETVETYTEKTALVGVRGGGMFRSACDVLDTADPSVKVFRFKEGCQWGSTNGVVKPASPDAIWTLTIYSHWSEFDVGKKEGVYRITAVLDVPPGCIAAYEGTTKPEVQPASANDDTEDRRFQIENSIMLALESEPCMPLSTLKRKTHAYRHGLQWDACLNRMAEAGDLVIEERRTISGQVRTWVLTPASAVTSTNVSGVAKSREE
jgi:hypothetical protein